MSLGMDSPVWGFTVPRGPCSAGRRVEGSKHPDGAAEVRERASQDLKTVACLPHSGQSSNTTSSALHSQNTG